MDQAPADRPPGGSVVVERFHPSAGRWLGVVALVALAVVAVLVLVSVPNLGGATAVVGLALGGVVVWVALVRPTVVAYDDRLHLRNLLRDTDIPWSLVEGAAVRQTLQVYAGDEVHHAVAIGRSARQRRAEIARQRSTAGGVGPLSFGFGRMLRAGTSQTPGKPFGQQGPTSETSYPDYVVQRVDALARNAPAAGGGQVVTRRWALPELAALVCLTVAFVVMLAVR